MEPPWVRGTKVCLQGLGHMTKISAMPIYGNNPIFILRNQLATIGLGMQHWGHGPIIVCSHDNPWLTLTLFMARSNLAPYAFVWEKMKTMDFSGNIMDFVMKLASMGHNDIKVSIDIKILSPRSYSLLLPGLYTCTRDVRNELLISIWRLQISS